MRYIIPVFLFLMLATTVSAEFIPDIALGAPIGGQNVTTATRFSFTIGSGEMINSCSLLVDGQVTKSVTYDAVQKGRTLSFAMIAEPGEHSWTVECTTPNGKITAPAASFTLEMPESPVTVKASGTVRGSMVHIFTLENNAQQEPVVVPKVATGDFIEVGLKIPPSSAKKEFYVRQRTLKNGTPTLWMTYKQENYYITQGENTTLNVTTSSKVIVTLDSVVNNRAVLIFYPYGVAAQAPAEQVPEETPNEPEAPVVKPETSVNGTNVTDTPGRSEDAPGQEKAPGQSGFKRFLGWLAGIFG